MEQVVPSQLAEITLVASPEELRKIAAFISAAADNMERMGPVYSHEHLADTTPGFEGAPHFVVAKAD